MPSDRAPEPPPALPPPVFEADFSSATNNCALINYRGRTPFAFGQAQGRPCVTFVGTQPFVKKPEPDTAWGFRSKQFSVAGGRSFAVLVELAGNPPVMPPRPSPRLVWLDAKGKDLLVQDVLGRDVVFAEDLTLPTARADGGVVRAYTQGRVPPTAVKARLDFMIDWPNLLKGARVELRRVAYFEGETPSLLGDIEPPVLDLLNTSPSRDLTAPLRFRVTDPSGVDWAETEVRIDGERIDVAQLLCDGDIRRYVPKTPWKADSIHRVEVMATDRCGNVGYDCGFIAFTDRTPRHPACTVRDDGMVQVDGRPVFPLGWARVRPCRGNGYDLARGVSDMAANAMTCAHTYLRYPGPGGREGAYFDQLVAACEKYGIMLYAEPSNRKPRDGSFLPLIATNLFRGLDYRLPLVWGIGDDTTAHVSVDELKFCHRCCKAVDPTALTASADGARPGGQTAYVPHADLLFVETYPIREEKPQDGEMASSVAPIDNAWASVREANVPNRSVLALPQSFRGWTSWKRQPTIDEMRCQAYLCIAARARGVVFYASCGESGPLAPPAAGTAVPPQEHFAPLDLPALKAPFFALMRELGALAPRLARRDAKEQPVVTVTKGPARNPLGGPSVRCLLKEDGLLVLANSAPTNLTATIRLPSGATLVRALPRFAGFAEGTAR